MDHTVSNIEFSRPVDVSELTGQSRAISVRATHAECEALCRRFELEELRALSARVRVTRAHDGEGAPAIRVQAALHAEVVRICVVTLEPFAHQVDEEFTILFRPAADLPRPAGVADETMSGDSPEPLDGPEIDVGELVAQHLLLALDPHPRRPGAAVELGGEAAPGADTAPPPYNPFAKLGQLKHKM
ncbi:MAG: DUF177 domain-containing protein [Alphaproteobacteria bacterium]|nr:DUF177 domain-containing protein [Alphaproteobacteria bacterium]MDP6590537.1 DUF177 domain-containing protein [Alphaproteobacteria bacterium]MDP6817105.1 DUF177 domain-containing protein [Alphaproteobacteria bacterium]